MYLYSVLVELAPISHISGSAGRRRRAGNQSGERTTAGVGTAAERRGVRRCGRVRRGVPVRGSWWLPAPRRVSSARLGPRRPPRIQRERRVHRRARRQLGAH